MLDELESEGRGERQRDSLCPHTLGSHLLVDAPTQGSPEQSLTTSVAAAPVWLVALPEPQDQNVCAGVSVNMCRRGWRECVCMSLCERVCEGE